MLSRAKKEEQVAELREKFGRAVCVYVADYRGLDVESANDLRGRLHREGAGDFEYRVTKNSVLKVAAADSDVERIAQHFQGPTAIAISYGDPVGLARVLSDFANDHEVFEIKGGLLEGEALEPPQIAQLATLPPLDTLRAQLVGLVQAPASKLARLLNEPGAQLARLVEAHRHAQESGAS